MHGCFLGMDEGDIERLRRVFQIASGPIPKAEGEPFGMRLVPVDRTDSVAVAKVAVRNQSRGYTDYLMLKKSAVG